MTFHVERQVVRTGETSVTVGTLEWFAASVLPEVSRQFVRAGEPPFAALPAALVRLLTWSGWRSSGRDVDRITEGLGY